MIEELIEKVFQLRKINKLYGYGYISSEKQGYNRAIKDILKIIKHYEVHDDLINKVSSWWDEVYPADIFTGVSGDEGAVKVAEIRELLDKIKAMSERSEL